MLSDSRGVAIICILFLVFAHFVITCIRKRSSDYAELGPFTLMFFERRVINVPIFITHVHSYCFAH